ncbi:MAG TPA: tetratricopeptide repeat protein [Polyangia bacterium]|nr:tetratricopeptide repeat protein [Polyangia bacterium]
MIARRGFALAVVVAASLLAGRARADRLDDAWKSANDAYLRGDYAAAVSAYEQLDRQVVSSELAFHLGNAYYRKGQLGPAIWSWERALALDPDQDDARYNLEQARKVAATRVQDKIEGADREPAWMRLVSLLPGTSEVGLFAALYLAFFGALALRLRARRAGGSDDGHAAAWTAVAAILGVTVALAAALLVGRLAMNRLPVGVVLPDQVAVKEGADANYKTSFDVHAGLRVRLLEHDQDWVRIRLANGLEGWVRDRDVGRL